MARAILILSLLAYMAACAPAPTELPQDFDPTFEF